jgi:uncharacterized protein
MQISSPRQPEPRLVLGRVWHARLKPFVHAFRYKAFYVQLPLKSLRRRSDAHGRVGSWAWGLNRWALLSVHDRDHGDGRPLLDWAADQLSAAGVHDADGEIWLQTFPRMLGYVFKPVSFWFCERADGSIRAVIAEVNNTFGDRHVYVLDPATGTIQNGQTLSAKKAFYVSPFFEVRGHYQFRFFKSGLGGQDLARIEYQDQSTAVLLTSMSGMVTPLTSHRAALAWCRSPLFSLGVIARIHWQALRLWIKGAKFISRDDAQRPSPLN